MTTTKTKKTMKVLPHSRALLICKMSWITLSTKTSYHIHLKTVNKVTMRKMRIWIRVTIHALKLWTIKFPSRCPTRSKSPIPICQSMKKRQSLAKGHSKSPMVLPYISASTGKAKTYPTLWKLLSRSWRKAKYPSSCGGNYLMASSRIGKLRIFLFDNVRIELYKILSYCNDYTRIIGQSALLCSLIKL